MAARGKNRDQQRSKVYEWERQCIFPHYDVYKPKGELSLADCATLSARMCEMYGLRAPRMHDGRRHRNAVAYAGSNTIALPLWARTLPIVAHETAHIIAIKKYDEHPGHGPVFVRVYLDLLAQFGKMPLTENGTFSYRSIRKAATEAHIKVATKKYVQS